MPTPFWVCEFLRNSCLQGASLPGKLERRVSRPVPWDREVLLDHCGKTAGRRKAKWWIFWGSSKIPSLEIVTAARTGVRSELEQGGGFDHPLKPFAAPDATPDASPQRRRDKDENAKRDARADPDREGPSAHSLLSGFPWRAPGFSACFHQFPSVSDFT